MERKTTFLWVLLWIFMPFVAFAQEMPTAKPSMIVFAADGSESEETTFDGSAPMKALFQAHPEYVGDYTPFYEWRFSRQTETKPFLVRYEEETEYTFLESGAFVVELYISFVQGSDTIEFSMEEPFMVNISESKLEIPNAFTPNGDGVNDVFKVKEGYQSIVTFEAAVFNRWGKKLYEWKDLDGGWDGKSGGSDVPDGAYYLVVKAQGADGRNYNKKKVINLLRGYTESGTE
jgi:gliding motility-associated-like protein